MVAVVVVVMVCASMCGISGGGKEIQDVYMLHYLVLSLLFVFLFFCMCVNLAFHEDNLLPLQQTFYEQFYIHTATMMMMTMMISIASCFFCSAIFILPFFKVEHINLKEKRKMMIM